MPTSEKDIPVREKLSSERPGFTRRFNLVYFEDNDKGERVKKELTFYIKTGLYDDGRLGEIFITCTYKDDFIRGAMDAMATMVSLGLQHGVPLKTITEKLRHNTFGPSGLTGDQEFRRCTSVFDLIAQYLDAKFPNGKLIGMPEAAEPEVVNNVVELNPVAKTGT
jgi:ribonucleoside-diphosphate reductase alpha chain